MVAALYARPASPGRRAGCPAAPFCKVAALPGGVARLAEQNLLQAERRLDDGASHEAAIVCATALYAPHVLYADTEGHASPGRRAGCPAALHRRSRRPARRRSTPCQTAIVQAL